MIIVVGLIGQIGVIDLEVDGKHYTWMSSIVFFFFYVKCRLLDKRFSGMNIVYIVIIRFGS